jgi:hypothetical protein
MKISVVAVFIEGFNEYWLLATTKRSHSSIHKESIIFVI